MGDDSEWMKLPTDQKVISKIWKARVAGYEEAIKIFKTAGDEKSPEFTKYHGFMGKFVIDSNAIAQEKALDAVSVFVENSHASICGKVASDVCGGVVLKGLNSSRTKTKEKAIEILMLYIEAEKQETVQEELIKGLSNKQPKIVAACVFCLREALRCFGNKVMPIKPLVKSLQKILEDRDKNVREEAKALVVEMFRWIGGAIKPQLSNLKPVQLTELEAEFEKLPPGKAIQERYLRSQQELKAKHEEAAFAAEEGGGGDGDDDEEEAEDVDPYELMTAVDIVPLLPKDYFDKIEAKKWQERKEALDAVLKLVTDNKKIESGDNHDLMKTIKKVVAKDSNVMLVTLAAKIIAGLAAGMRKKFSNHAVSCMEVVTEKFKEKKITVVTALREASDAIFLTTTLEAISEPLIEMLGHKTPTVKNETASLLARCFQRSTPTTLPKKLLKAFAVALLKTVNDTNADVREASFIALGTAMKVVSEKHMMPFLADLDNIKMTKIKECCDKAELIGKSGKPVASKAAAAPAKPAAAAPAKSAPAAKPAAKGPPKVVKGGGGSRPKTAPAKAGGKKPAKKAAGGGADESAFQEKILSDEAVEEEISVFLPGDTVPGLASANWKERLASMEKFTQVVQGATRSEIPCQVCIRTVTKKPGLKENNFQVMKFKVELIAHLAKNANFSKQAAEFCLGDLVDKIADVKNGAGVKEALSSIAEATSLLFISEQVISQAMSQKNPKTQAEALNWLADAIKEFGFKVNPKGMIKQLKQAFSATNPAVRTAAITLVGVMHMYMGAPLRMMFDDEKPALLTQIDAEIDKIKGQKPPPPTRGLSAKGGGDAGDDDDDEEDEAGEEVNVADLVPRTDISDKITDEVLGEMADKNWKIRNEGLQKIQAILNEAKFITPSIGSLPEALKLRLGDSNKILVNTTLSICTTLATAMGPHIKNHARIVGPGILANMGDSKPQVRAAAETCLNTWVEQGGLHNFVEGELLSDALKLENPNLRITLLAWLSAKLPDQKKLPVDELKLCIPYVFSCLNDRKGEVRAEAQKVIMPLMIHTKYEPMVKVANKLDPKSKATALKLLETAREELPKPAPKPVKQSKAAAKAPTPEAPEPVNEVASSYDDEEPARPATAPAKSGGAAKGKGKPAAGAGKKVVASKKKGKEEEEDNEPPLKTNNLKDQRFKDEKNMKVFKWNFTTPRAEFTDQLRTQMETSFSYSLVGLLCHADFKQHIKAIDILSKEVSNTSATISNLDIILKWMTLRFFDTNTTVLLKSLEYIDQLFGMLNEQDYHVQEQEAVSFVPYLVNKVGDPKDNVRKSIRSIFKQICHVYPASKMFSFIIDGIKSKNSKQRAECLEELGHMIEIYGITICQPSPAQAIKLVAQQIGDRDKGVRSAALNTVVAAYSILGETVYKYVGRISDKDMDMLEERIKRSAKQAASKPGPTIVKPAAPAQDKPTKLSPDEKSKIQENARRGIPKSGKPQQQKNKYFSLDFEESDEDDNLAMPKLEEYNLEEEPVMLPQRKFPGNRPPSPSMKLLRGSQDAKSAIDLVISQIASSDITTSIQAMAQIDEVLKDNEKCQLLEGHMDQMLVAISLQLRLCYTKHMGCEDTPKQSTFSLYRSLIATLLSLFQTKSLAKEATKDVLKDLLYNLLTILIDSRLNNIEDGAQLIRSVNVMVVKIVEKSNHTAVMGALLKLLQESVSNETTSGSFQELIMKCLWKNIRLLPNFINDLNLDSIIGDIHQFLKTFPSSSWKNRKDDVPLRTVKTLLHTIAKRKGRDVLGHLSQVDTPNSEVEAYLHKVLKTTGADINTVMNTQNEQMNGNAQTAKKEMGKSPSNKRLSKSTHDMLAEIFKKIGSKENTREGLNDLYDFKSKHPDADLEPFLKKSSQFFQSYIERGLKNIALEREGQMKTSSSEPNMASSHSTGSLSSNASVPEDNTATAFLERLKVLRARCGLDNTGGTDNGPASNTEVIEPIKPNLLSNIKAQDSGSNSSLSSNSSAGLPQLGSSVKQSTEENDPTTNALSNLADLKKRLEKIKSKQTS